MRAWDNGSFNAHGIGETDCTITYEVNGNEESKSIHFVSTPFPIKNGYFNPSIWTDGTFNEATGEFSTGQWGFAGWRFSNGLDLSDYNYLIAEIESPQTNGLSFRVFDTDNYWAGCHSEPFENSTRAVIDLKNMRKDSGEKVDPSHLYIVGFWSNGGQKFKLKSVFPANDRNAEAGVESIYTAEDGVVDVYNMQGVCLRRGIAADEAARGLPNGLYIIGGKKIMVKN